MVSRKLAREMAVEFLFQIQFHREDIKEQVENFLDSMEDLRDGVDFDKDYFFEIVNGVINCQEEIDGIISAKAKDGWTLERIAKVDLSILRVAIYEMKHRTDIPVSVSINEAVEIAKKFSAVESSGFINGLLAQV